jgi:low affinity Fe/Cu permease
MKPKPPLPTPTPHGPGVVERWTMHVTQWVGSVPAFLVATLVVIAWAVTGPIFKYSDTWQLVINTGTTIVTFLMVFLIQRSQNKDTLALQLKLNEIVAAVAGASNRLIDVENLSEEDIHRLHDHYQRLAKVIQTPAELTCAHSVEEDEIREAAPDVEKELARNSADPERRRAAETGIKA